jgi:hypothetical protein
MKLRSISIFVSSLLACGLARADILTYLADSVPDSDTNWTVNMAGVSAFNPSLGTLTQVKLNFSSTISQSLYAHNDNAITSTAGPLPYSAQSLVSLSVSLAGGPAIFTSSPFNFSHSGSLTSSQTWFDSTTVTWNPQTIYTSANDLALFSGSTPLLFTATATDDGLFTASPGNGGAGHYSSAAGQLTVEYTYSPIPEPATYAALLGSLTLMAIEHRRRAARRLV